MQINTDWRPDIPSLLLGLLLGVGLAYVFVRLLPTFRRQYKRGRGWVEGRISWMRSGVEVRFQAETADYAQSQHLGAGWATLDQVFVPTKLTAPIDDYAMLEQQRGAVQMALWWPELAGRIGAPVLPTVTLNQLLLNGRRVIISGAAGSGKTTLLAYLAHRLSTAVPTGPDKAFADVVPVFLHLAEINWADMTPEGAGSTKAETAPDPVAPLANALQKRSSPITSPGVGDLLRRKLATEQAILLLDGWAELPVAQRPPMLAWLKLFVTTYSKVRIFITTAHQGYGHLLPFGFTHTIIQPWRLGEVQTVIARWAEALALPSPPPLDTCWQPGQTALETSLRLWLVALSGPETAANPRFQPALLPAALALFQPRKKEEPLTPPDGELLAFWEEIACALMDKELLALPGERAIGLAEALAGTNGEEVDKGHVGRLRKSLAQNRLFVRWGNGTIGFRCTLFRDYLTASCLVNTDRQAVIATRLSDAQWRGVWPWFAAQSDPTGLAALLLPTAEADPIHDAWFQVASWLPQTEVQGNWRRQVMINLGQMARQPETPDVLRLRAMAALAYTGEEGLLTFVNQLLSRSDPFSRQMGTAVLPLINDDKVVNLLAERLADDDLVVRYTALYGLALLQHNALTERPLVTALIGDNEEVGLLTAEMLAYNAGPGVEILQEAAKDEDIQVRRAAVHGLALLDEPWIEPMLADMERNDKEWFVRSAASGAIETIRRRRQPQPWHPIRAADQAWLEGIALAQGKRVPSGQAAVAFVMFVFKEATEAPIRAAAAQLLGQLPAKEAMPVLQATFGDAEAATAVRDAAFKAWCALHRAYGQ